MELWDPYKWLSKWVSLVNFFTPINGAISYKLQPMKSYQLLTYQGGIIITSYNQIKKNHPVYKVTALGEV